MSQPSLNRRLFLRGAAAVGGAAAIGGIAAAPASARSAPAFTRSGRPAITHGIQSGEVSASGGVVWARADRLAQMLVEVSPTETFAKTRTIAGPIVTGDTDFIGKVALEELPAGGEVFYRVTFASPDDPKATSEPAAGRFVTAPSDRRDVSFVWTGDTAGQGWGINPDFGGMVAYEAMRQTRPDFFIHSGDTIYADGPIEAVVELPDGTVWRNVVTEAKSKVAETLAEYRGNFQYNLLDTNVRGFNAEVPIYAQWDDHEVTLS